MPRASPRPAAAVPLTAVLPTTAVLFAAVLPTTTVPLTAVLPVTVTAVAVPAAAALDRAGGGGARNEWSRRPIVLQQVKDAFACSFGYPPGVISPLTRHVMSRPRRRASSNPCPRHSITYGEYWIARIIKLVLGLAKPDPMHGDDKVTGIRRL